MRVLTKTKAEIISTLLIDVFERESISNVMWSTRLKVRDVQHDSTNGPQSQISIVALNLELGFPWIWQDKKTRRGRLDSIGTCFL